MTLPEYVRILLLKLRLTTMFKRGNRTVYPNMRNTHYRDVKQSMGNSLFPHSEERRILRKSQSLQAAEKTNKTRSLIKIELKAAADKNTWRENTHNHECSSVSATHCSYHHQSIITDMVRYCNQIRRIVLLIRWYRKHSPLQWRSVSDHKKQKGKRRS